MSISTTIKSIQDIMRKDVGVDGDAQRIGQLVWMFFLKIFDDKEAEYELLDDDYRSPIPARLRWRNWAADAEGITGDEKKPLPHLLATTNMILHGLDVPTNVRHDNTLARPLRDYGPRDRVDVIVTNPPFGGMEEDGIESNFPANFRTRETADLFLVLIMHLLKDGGRAAVVLPDGTLFGEGIKTRIKEQLLSTCNLHTVVRLPNGVFNPYTGIKTNLLFFTKGTPTEEVWFYEHPYPPGYKNYSKTRPMRIEEFDAEKAWWTAREENEHAWKVSAADIRARNYNLDIKNPHSPEAESLDPDELLAAYAELQTCTQSTRDELKAVLSDALASHSDSH